MQSVETDHATRPVGTCRNCGYDLRGIASRRCPECGSLFLLDDVLQSEQGIALMAPTRWIGHRSIAIASPALLLDAWFCPTSITLLILAFLWLLVAWPYILGSRRRRRLIFRRHPKHGLADPDIPMRRRIATIFLIVALIIGSRMFEWAVFRISFPFIESYVEDVYENQPMLSVQDGLMITWRGFAPIRIGHVGPNEVTFYYGVGRFEYSPNYLPYSSSSSSSFWWPNYNAIDTAVPLTGPWYIDEPPWNIVSIWDQISR